MKTRMLILCFLTLSLFLKAQNQPAPLSKDEIKETIDSISSILEREYVFADIGKKISEHLQGKAKNGEYDKVSDPHEFAQTLTEDVRFVNNDKHLRVNFAPEMIAERNNVVSKEDSLAFAARQRKYGQSRNHGFKEVKILDGNIGYLNLEGFYGVDEESGRTAEAAMNFLSNADALIIDLRTNGGGSPSMIQLITSYLFDAEPVHLNNFYYRPQDEISQTWTLPYVPGKRSPDTDVYVLTSSNTFSAAEEFSYNLRNLKRATLIGEVTGGGAHPGGTRVATDKFTVWVPSGRAINPISKTNWEGTGVKPHIEVEADKALTVAKITAMEKLLKKANEDEKTAYEWALASLKAEQNPINLDKETLMSYVGNFGPRVITYKDEHLFYSREGRSPYQLIPLSEELFSIAEIPYFRIKIIKENGEVTGILGLYDNGRTDKNMKGEAKKTKP
jgi:retinol-binding protein 3